MIPNINSPHLSVGNSCPTIARTINWGTDYLKYYQIDDARLEAEILLSYSIKITRTKIIIDLEKVLTPEDFAKYNDLIVRRSLHEPSAYITRIQPFMSLDFFVDRSVLIPRPETELLVETAITYFKSPTINYTIADIGTGSGAIAISLAKYLPNVKVIGIDSSAAAIEIAQKNAKYHKVNDRRRFIQGNLFEPLTEPVNIIISNPPYIPSADIDNLQPEVRDWEPRFALDGGPDGLDYIKQLISEGPKYLKENGYLILEFGENQAEKIKSLSEKQFKEIKIIKDYSGIERIIFAGKPATKRRGFQIKSS